MGLRLGVFRADLEVHDTYWFRVVELRVSCGGGMRWLCPSLAQD